MSISVVIPTINREGLLQRAVRSVIDAVKHQNLASGVVELIIVNDSAETVNLDELNTELVPIKVINSPKAPFGGPSLARHVGIIDSDAELIFILDDDDFFLPNRFEQCLPIYRENKSVDAVLEPSVRRDTNTGVEFIAGAKSEVDDGFDWMLGSDRPHHIATGATSFRRSSYFDVGGLDLKLRQGEDGELLLRLAYSRNVVFTYPDAVVVCERHDSNISRETNIHYYQSMKAISSLYKNTRVMANHDRDEVLKTFIQGKFCYLVSMCASEFSYPKRVFETLRVAYYYPWGLANAEIYKALCVALFKINYR